MTDWSNTWLNIGKAKKIVRYLKRKYMKRAVHEDLIIQAMWDHPLYMEDMWLNVHWDDDDRVYDIEVGVGGILVD
jgi:hypothetical protein